MPDKGAGKLGDAIVVEIVGDGFGVDAEVGAVGVFDFRLGVLREGLRAAGFPTIYLSPCNDGRSMCNRCPRSEPSFFILCRQSQIAASTHLPSREHSV